MFINRRILAKTTLIQQSIVSNLFSKSLLPICLASLCHNNGRVKLVRTWCNVQSTLYSYYLASCVAVIFRPQGSAKVPHFAVIAKHITFEVIRHLWSTSASSSYTGLPMHACSLSVSPSVPNW